MSDVIAVWRASSRFAQGKISTSILTSGLVSLNLETKFAHSSLWRASSLMVGYVHTVTVCSSDLVAPPAHPLRMISAARLSAATRKSFLMTRRSFG